ncbi:MAG: glutamyl-tRNA reductase [Actinobacteria bacterium]|nr:MAG: glutamyl-tRNA reductase [Actinomycetota bacterium]TMM23954.1 MAG: glutamyl-tRNA reductase [Actinomycetota bacterium]
MAELSLVGISHHGASLEVRERVALDPDEAADLARELAGDEGEAVCLSTCNRTELYVAGPGAEERAAGALSAADGALYRRGDDEAARHLFRVAAGLDSRVRGETEILGQVRAAYALGAPGPLLDRLFREALRVGRKVRTQAQVGDPGASAASAAAVLAERVLGDLTDRQVLLIGAGEIGEATAGRLVARGARVAFVANRGEERRARVARRLEAEPLTLGEVASALAEADVVVASTNSRSFQVSHDDVERALASRERRPLLLIDLAVPRDLDPEIANLPYAFLYDVDDLDEAVGTGTVEGAAARAEAIVAEEGERFRAWQASRGVVPAIASLRARAEEIRLRELERAGRRLADLSPEERRVVEAVTVQIVNKLLHDPTVRLKEAAAGADGAAYADAVRHLFSLEPDQDRQPR